MELKITNGFGFVFGLTLGVAAAIFVILFAASALGVDLILYVRHILPGQGR